MWNALTLVLGRPIGRHVALFCESQPSVQTIVVIAHNLKAFDFYFILNRPIDMKWQVELIMNEVKIMCTQVCDYLVFLDSISFLPFALRKLTEALGLTVAKSW